MVERDERELRERPTSDLVSELSRQVSTLVRQEIELAKTEAAEKGRRAGVGAGMFGGAGVAALLALGSLTAFLVLVLDLAMPAWVAALIVTALWGAVAALLALTGRQKIEEARPAPPQETVESVKEDAEWLRERMKSGER